MKIAFIDLGDTRGELNEPLGVECISSRIIGELNADVDMYWYGMNEKCSLEKLPEYDCIGISMNIGSLHKFEEIYFYLKDKKPGFPLILGGCIPTFAYRELLEKYDNIICMYGEGEQAWFDIASRLCKSSALVIDESLSDIGNLAFKLNGEIKITEAKSLDLSAEKPVIRNKKFLDHIKKKHGIVRIEGSRGCSWNKCSFCCVNAKYADPSWRGFSIQKILDELIELSDMGFLSPYFTDEDFFGQQYDRAVELGNEIINLKKQGKINKDMNLYISILAADTISEAGKEALRVLKLAGLREVFIGVESLQKEQLKRYNKKSSADVNRRSIEFIKELGLELDSGYILFDPVISFDELGSSIDYLTALNYNEIDSRCLKRLRLQPMTVICGNMSDMITGELDVNDLEYKYEFRDKKVGAVYEKYSAWEQTHKDGVWKIQSASRGEIDESLRDALKALLGRIRDVDFQVIKYIYRAVKDNCESQDNDFLNSLINQKDRLIKEGYEIIEKI